LNDGRCQGEDRAGQGKDVTNQKASWESGGRKSACSTREGTIVMDVAEAQVGIFFYPFFFFFFLLLLLFRRTEEAREVQGSGGLIRFLLVVVIVFFFFFFLVLYRSARRIGAAALFVATAGRTMSAVLLPAPGVEVLWSIKADFEYTSVRTLKITSSC